MPIAPPLPPERRTPPIRAAVAGERQHVEADVRRARGGEAVAEQRARQRRAERRDDEHADEQPVDRDAGHARRAPVAADRADVPADAQVPEHERGDDEDPERDEAPDREDLQDRLVEPEADRVVLVDHALRVAEDVRDPEDHQVAAERHRHRVQPEAGDQAALDRADDDRGAERREDAEQRRAGAGQHRDHAAEQVHRRDGEIELARDDRDAERQRHEAVRGEVLEDVVDVGRAHRVVREHGQERERHDHPARGSRRAPRRPRAAGGASSRPCSSSPRSPAPLPRLVSTTTTTTMMPRTRICTPVE